VQNKVFASSKNSPKSPVWRYMNLGRPLSLITPKALPHNKVLGQQRRTFGPNLHTIENLKKSGSKPIEEVNKFIAQTSHASLARNILPSQQRYVIPITSWRINSTWNISNNNTFTRTVVGRIEFRGKEEGESWWGAPGRLQASDPPAHFFLLSRILWSNIP